MTPPGPGHVLRVLVVPAGVAAVALILAGFVGHVQIGLLLAVGVALGAANGLLMEAATARMTPDADPDRKDIVRGALGRLGIITVVALVIAYLARPDGWVVLLGVAGYQILMLTARLSAAAKEARLG
ncbi:MAG: hypothetical protein M3P04_05450 [Actinomycetota bacterium]|nr:hypothetical protein [Actinomycetota bacterium]